MAGQLNVLSICGSLRKGSFNAMVERALPGLAPASMKITPAPPFDKFPLYNFDIHQQQGIPADVMALANAVLAADGVIIVTPEYNFTIPAGLKNAIDWLSRLKDPSPFAGKPFAIQSASTGMLGGARMQYHLRQVLAGLNAFVLGPPEIFINFAKTKVDEEKRELTDEATRELIRKQLAAFAALIERFAPRAERPIMDRPLAQPGEAMTTATAAHSPEETQALRRAYYERIGQKNMAPLWEVLRDIVPKEPMTPFLPTLWRFKDFKPLVFEGGDLITAKEAERRVLVLENPGVRGKSAVAQSLYAGIQLVLPGEIAPPHRHTAGAIRFILEGAGAYTQVDGEKAEMHPGDFVITPSWTAHDHGNDTKEPIMWLDVLDVPMVNFYAAAFYEDLGEEPQNTRRESGDSIERFGSGVYPDGSDTSLKRSPIVNYPYARMKPILQRLQRNGEVDPRHGARVRYANPFNGGWVTPTMGAHLALLPKGFRGKPYRATDSTIFACAEGSGRTRVGNDVLEWTRNDVFVVPSWKSYSHEADNEAVLFSISDRPAQEALGIWREESAD